MNTEPIAWIAADWGTSNLRCWAMSADHRVLEKRESTQGMGTLSGQGGAFETALLELIGPWLQNDRLIPVHACGMVSARGGWLEVPYEEAPCPAKTSVTKIPTRNSQIEVFVHAGVCQTHPADVMRGEETQISGFLAGQPEFSGTLCLPGTHTKWVTVAEGTIRTFRTCITGEMFDLLSSRSVLRHTIATDGWNESAFLSAVKTSREKPAAMLNECFRLRAEAVLRNLDGVEARSRLSGLLIGQELSGSLNAASFDSPVIVIGAPELTQIYRTALEFLGISVKCHSAESCVLLGLAQTVNRLKRP